MFRTRWWTHARRNQSFKRNSLQPRMGIVSARSLLDVNPWCLLSAAGFKKRENTLSAICWPTMYFYLDRRLNNRRGWKRKELHLNLRIFSEILLSEHELQPCIDTTGRIKHISKDSPEEDSSKYVLYQGDKTRWALLGFTSPKNTLMIFGLEKRQESTRPWYWMFLSAMLWCIIWQ